jgi:DNA-directed DNA polymerase III PolC
VVAQPVHCISETDEERLQLLAAIRANTPLNRLPPESLRTGPVYWISPEAMQERYARFGGVLEATGELAHACRSCLPDGNPIWPELDLPAGQSPDETLRALALTGLEQRFGGEAGPDVTARLDRELASISAHGYAPLFLVVADVVRFSRDAGIPVSTRGSVANSLVAYASGITTVDPVEHDLLFERFLNPARSDVPDIDLDFCSRRRDEVLDYVRRRYGPDRVAIIGAMSTMQLQSAIRETAKAYELPEADAGRLAALAPRAWHPDPRRRDRRTAEDVLTTLDNPLHREVVRRAYGLVGQPDHLSLHPGGVVVTPGPLTDYVPIQLSPKGFYVAQYEHGDIERLGLPKIDLLGIRALTVLADAAELVRRHHDPRFRVEEIPLDDAATGRLLAEGETIGVFQCESEGAQSTLRKLRASTVRDLAVANAFFKPGPATGGMAGAFVRRYRGEEPVSYLHPSLAEILGPTRGVLLFQEQILRVATEVAGLTWRQADQLRKGMSHFGAKQMEALRETFVAGCMRTQAGPGLSATQATMLWEQVVAFAGYGFNQGHATAYADVSFRSAYLKRHWPAAFLAARLADRGGFHHPAVYIAEARRLGITVRPPHVNHSDTEFAYCPADPRPVLWMGLGQVRELTHKGIERIVAARAERPFASLPDLVGRVELRPQEIAHLIQCGALDGLGANRPSLLSQAAALASQRTKPRARPGQLSLPLAIEREPEALTVAPSPTAADPALLKSYLEWEQHLLGFPVSVHPLDLITDRLPPCMPLSEVAMSRNVPIVTAGARLPGWTGGQSFYLSDGAGFVRVRMGRDGRLHTPVAWQPVIIRGRCVQDEYGNAWLLAEKVAEMM